MFYVRVPISRSWHLCEMEEPPVPSSTSSCPSRSRRRKRPRPFTTTTATTSLITLLGAVLVSISPVQGVINQFRKITELDIIGLYQKATTSRDVKTIKGNCFAGLELTQCWLKNVYQGKAGAILEATNTAYDLTDHYGEGTYCLSCCSNNKDEQVDEMWDLTCKTTPLEASKANLYGYEFRFVRNKYPGDTAVTWCPIKRSECYYNADGSLDTNYACIKNTHNQIASYYLTLDVYQKTNGFKFWRSVEGCSVSVEETTDVPTKTVNETIYMHQSDLQWHAMPWQINFLFWLSLAIFTYLVRYIRHAHCLVCDRRLIYFKDLCFLCRLYGCEEPDPNLLARLQARDEKLRGKDFRLVEAQEVEYVKEKVHKYSALAWAFMSRKGEEIKAHVKNYKHHNTAVAPEEAVVIDIGEPRSTRNTLPTADPLNGDVIEIHMWDQQQWVVAHVISSRQVPPQPELIPEAVGLFNHLEQGVVNLSEAPEGFRAFTIQLMPSALPSAAREDAKVETGEEAPEHEVYFLTNLGRYGLLYDCQGDKKLVWRFAETRLWPPPRATIASNEVVDLVGMEEPYMSFYDPRRRRRRKSSMSSMGGVTGAGGNGESGDRQPSSLLQLPPPDRHSSSSTRKLSSSSAASAAPPPTTTSTALQLQPPDRHTSSSTRKLSSSSAGAPPPTTTTPIINQPSAPLMIEATTTGTTTESRRRRSSSSSSSSKPVLLNTTTTGGGEGKSGGDHPHAKRAPLPTSTTSKTTAVATTTTTSHKVNGVAETSKGEGGGGAIAAPPAAVGSPPKEEGEGGGQGRRRERRRRQSENIVDRDEEEDEVKGKEKEKKGKDKDRRGSKTHK